jgi:hypothetical protein
MYRKALYIGLASLIGALLLALSLSLLPRGPGKITFTQDTVSEISTGMTRNEVEAILGCPPGDYTTGPCDCPPCNSWTFVCDWWVSDTGMIGVWFDDQGKSKEMVFRTMERIPQPFWQEILDRLRSSGSRGQTPRWNGKNTWPPKN